MADNGGGDGGSGGSVGVRVLGGGILPHTIFSETV